MLEKCKDRPETAPPKGEITHKPTPPPTMDAPEVITFDTSHTDERASISVDYNSLLESSKLLHQTSLVSMETMKAISEETTKYLNSALESTKIISNALENSTGALQKSSPTFQDSKVCVIA